MRERLPQKRTWLIIIKKNVKIKREEIMKERWMRCLTVGIFLAVLCLGAAGLSRKENRTEETAQTVQT